MPKKHLIGVLGGGIALILGGIAVLAITDNAGGFVLMIAGCFLLAMSIIRSREE